MDSNVLLCVLTADANLKVFVFQSSFFNIICNSGTKFRVGRFIVVGVDSIS